MDTHIPHSTYIAWPLVFYTVRYRVKNQEKHSMLVRLAGSNFNSPFLNNNEDNTFINEKYINFINEKT